MATRRPRTIAFFGKLRCLFLLRRVDPATKGILDKLKIARGAPGPGGVGFATAKEALNTPAHRCSNHTHTHTHNRRAHRVGKPARGRVAGWGAQRKRTALRPAAVEFPAFALGQLDRVHAVEFAVLLHVLREVIPLQPTSTPHVCSWALAAAPPPPRRHHSMGRTVEFPGPQPAQTAAHATTWRLFALPPPKSHTQAYSTLEREREREMG
jgi:hypothetical protein